MIVLFFPLSFSLLFRGANKGHLHKFYSARTPQIDLLEGCRAGGRGAGGPSS